jgi:hypothetical protein
VSDIQVLQNKDSIVVRVPLPDVKANKMLTVVKATFMDGVLEVVMEPAKQEVAAPKKDDAVEPSKIFPE